MTKNIKSRRPSKRQAINMVKTGRPSVEEVLTEGITDAVARLLEMQSETIKWTERVQKPMSIESFGCKILDDFVLLDLALDILSIPKEGTIVQSEDQKRPGEYEFCRDLYIDIFSIMVSNHGDTETYIRWAIKELEIPRLNGEWFSCPEIENLLYPTENKKLTIRK